MSFGGYEELSSGFDASPEFEVELEWRRTVYHFFVLGVQLGVALCMFAIAMSLVLIMDQIGLVGELSSLYYPVFRWPVLLSFCGCAYGVTLLMWKRHAINFAAVLGVDESSHHFHYVIRSSFTVISTTFISFVG